MIRKTFIGVILLLGTIYFFIPLNRNNYRVVNFNEPQHQLFKQNYQVALLHHKNWLKDPQTIALRVAGYPNEDNTSPESVTLTQLSSNKIIVIVKSRGLMDDSIRQRETRVELVQQGEFWQIEWVGERYKCYRGGFGWTISLCS